MRRDTPRFQGQIESVKDGVISGWIFDSQEPQQSVFLTAYQEKAPVSVVRPTQYRPDIAQRFGVEKTLGFCLRPPACNSHGPITVVAPDRTIIGPDPTLVSVAPELHCPVIFLHIQRSMGTFVRDALATQMEAPDVLFVYPHSVGVSLAEFLALPALELARTRLIFGHIYFGIHECLPIFGRYRTVVRCPIERVLSNVFNRLATGATVDEALHFFMAAEDDEFDNYLTRILSGIAAPFGGIGERHIQIAFDNTQRWFDVIGFFDSVHTVEMALREFLVPGILQRHDNRTYDIAKAIPPFLVGAARERLLQAVRADIQLYCQIADDRGHPIVNVDAYRNLGVI